MECMEGSDRRRLWHCPNPSSWQRWVHLRHLRLQQRHHRSHTILVCDNIKEEDLGPPWGLWPAWAEGEARGQTWEPLQPQEFTGRALDPADPSLRKHWLWPQRAPVPLGCCQDLPRSKLRCWILFGLFCTEWLVWSMKKWIYHKCNFSFDVRVEFSRAYCCHIANYRWEERYRQG